jgi:TolA-binding protein
MAKKKKDALDNLLSSGKISESTFEVFSKEIDEAIVEIERQQEALVDKMNSKMRDLQDQIKTIEMLFANFEIQHVAGEVDEEVYEKEIAVLSVGLETAKQELEAIRDAVNRLTFSAQIPAGGVEKEIEAEPSEVSSSKAEAEEAVAATEELSTTNVEFVEVSEAVSSKAHPEEALQSSEESESSEETTACEEKEEA